MQLKISKEYFQPATAVTKFGYLAASALIFLRGTLSVYSYLFCNFDTVLVVCSIDRSRAIRSPDDFLSFLTEGRRIFMLSYQLSANLDWLEFHVLS